MARTDGDYTAITAGKTNRRGELVILEVFTMKGGDPNYKQKLHAFYLKWHPNFLRRWLFRLFRI